MEGKGEKIRKGREISVDKEKERETREGKGDERKGEEKEKNNVKSIERLQY